MVELAQLFQDMEAAVITQEPAIQNTEEKTDNTVVNLDQGNKHLVGAVDKARAARRKKWICFWIVGEFIYAVLLIAIGARWLILASTHRHHHWGCGRGWGWSSGSSLKSPWGLVCRVPRSLFLIHSLTTSHDIPKFSFFVNHHWPTSLI